MHRILDPGTFLGGPHGRPARPGFFVGQSRFHGYVTVTAWAREEVIRLLPPELALAPCAGETASSHPVAFVFGKHVDTVRHFAGVALPGSPAYNELGMAVPFVTRRGGRALHLYMVRMYANYPPAVWAGNIYYGFSKELAEVTWYGPIFVVARSAGALLLHAQVGQSTPANGAADFEAVRGLFGLPVLGRRAGGSLVCSHFDWDARDASVRSAHAYVSLDGPVTPGLTPRRVDALPGTTFAVDGMRWRLSWPTSARDG
jgi:hypothetical protein